MGLHGLLGGALGRSLTSGMLGSGGGDDGSSNLIHLVLLLVIAGVVLCSSLHVIQHKAGWTWLPEPAVTLAVGLGFGLLIRLNVDDEQQVPEELGFSGSIFFLVLLPVIIFEGGFSLKKKEFFGQIGSILVLSILGTVISGLSIGAILYYAGNAGWSKQLEMNEALAYGSILASTDSLATTQQLAGLGIDRSFQALVYGEGSVNEAVALVMYDTFVHFIDDHGEDETAEYAFTRFFALLSGSIALGLAIGVLATWVFRLVHMDWRPNPVRALGDLIDFLCLSWCKRANPAADHHAQYVAARAALLRSPAVPIHGAAAAAAAAGGHGKELSGAAPAGGLMNGSPHPPAVQAAAIKAGLPADFDPREIVRNPPSLSALRVAAMLLNKEQRMRYEPKPSSSVFLQTSFILAMGYISYMAAEACKMSGVVAVLFCGISMNHFVRPLLTREGKRFSEGTIKVLSQTSDTSIYFQVGLDMGLTIATTRGIDTGRDGALLGWVILSILLGRAVTVMILSSLVNYYRRTPIPWQYLVALWHCGMRGAGTYAFTIIFPTENRDLLLDVTAATMLFTVFALGGTTVPLLRLLGIPYDPPGSHGHGHGEDEDEEHGGDGHGAHGKGKGGHGKRAEILGHGTMRYTAGGPEEGQGEGEHDGHQSSDHSSGADSGHISPIGATPRKGYGIIGGHYGQGQGHEGSTADGHASGPLMSPAQAASYQAASAVAAAANAGAGGNPAMAPPPGGRIQRTRSGYELVLKKEGEDEDEDEGSGGEAGSARPAGTVNLGLSRTNSRGGGLRSPSRGASFSKRGKGVAGSGDSGLAVLLTGDAADFDETLKPTGSGSGSGSGAGQGSSTRDRAASSGGPGAEGKGTGVGSRASRDSGLGERASVTVAVSATGDTYAYRQVMVGGARAFVPVFTAAPSASERAVSIVNAALSTLRYFVSGVLRDDKPGLH